MKKNMAAFILFILLFFFLPLHPVMADETEGQLSFNRHTGFYGEANLGTTLVWVPDFFGNDFATGGFIGPGWSIGGGYMFKHWLGVEAGYLQFKPEIGDYELETDIYCFYLTSRFNIPVKDRFSVFFKLGATTLSGSEEEAVADIAPFVGTGIGYALTDKIDIMAQFQGPNILFFGAGVLGVGIVYHF